MPLRPVSNPPNPWLSSEVEYLPGEVPGIVPTNQWKEDTLGDPIFPGEVYHAGIGQGRGGQRRFQPGGRPTQQGGR